MLKLQLKKPHADFKTIEKFHRKVVLNKDVRDGILSFCKIKHPNEGILVLRGKNKKKVLTIYSLIIPPFAYGGHSKSGFPYYRLPADTSYVGTVHSHPSGNPNPSLADLQNFWGLISLIVRYPYEDNDIFAWDSDGKAVELVAYDNMNSRS